MYIILYMTCKVKPDTVTLSKHPLTKRDTLLYSKKKIIDLGTYIYMCKFRKRKNHSLWLFVSKASLQINVVHTELTIDINIYNWNLFRKKTQRIWFVSVFDWFINHHRQQKILYLSVTLFFICTFITPFEKNSIFYLLFFVFVISINSGLKCIEFNKTHLNTEKRTNQWNQMENFI